MLAAVAVIAAGVVLAHSAAAMDHMGEAMAVCLALAESAALGAAALGAAAAPRGAGRWLAGSSMLERSAGGARRPVLPSPRGSPVALQVLRL